MLEILVVGEGIVNDWEVFVLYKLEFFKVLWFILFKVLGLFLILDKLLWFLIFFVLKDILEEFEESKFVDEFVIGYGFLDMVVVEIEDEDEVVNIIFVVVEDNGRVVG